MVGGDDAYTYLMDVSGCGHAVAILNAPHRSGFGTSICVKM